MIIICFALLLVDYIEEFNDFEVLVSLYWS